MKKLFIIILAITAALLSFSSCDIIDQILPEIEGIIGGNQKEDKTYVDFTPAEKVLIEEQIGASIPFVANNEYYLSKHTYSTEAGVKFTAYGNSKEEFSEYQKLFSDFTYSGSRKDNVGHVWYYYENNGVFYEISYYVSSQGDSCIELLAYVKKNVSNDGNQDDNTTGGSENDSQGENKNYKYTSFTDSEKETFTKFSGFVIPFIANDEYYVEAYAMDGEVGINFYAYGNTADDFAKYRESFASYTFVESYQDIYGDTWYTYQKGEFYIDISRYYLPDELCYLVDVYVYKPTDSSGGDSGESYVNTAFTLGESKMFSDFCGFVIPYVANNEYYVESYEIDGEVGINFYTVGNTPAEFAEYKNAFSKYTFIESYEDEYGDDWYTYQNGDYYIDISYYYYDADYGYLIDVYVYKSTDSDADDVTPGTGSGNLPEDNDGVYDIDFTKATNVKDVTDQGYYLDGCPTKGSPGVLVIPVDFSDVTAESRGYTTDAIKNAFSKNGDCDYYSVYDYYYISSYGQLTLDITVLDFWFRPSHPSTYYANATTDYFGDEIFIGDQLIMNEALAYLESRMDLSLFDSDGNSIIDAVVLINTLEISEEDFFWAYRYWNVYTDDEGYYYEYDGVSANDYLWASYQFLHESGNGADFDDVNAMNTYTFIHEFGHILGADDYYDTAGIEDPMGGCDIMDSLPGDHNAFTKFNFGWLTESRLVVTDESVTLTLEDFSKNGDTIILANSFDEKLGAYQEYYIIVYYTSNGLNNPEIGGGYFARDGIVVYHVNSTLYDEEYEGEIFRDIYNNNTSYTDDYGTKDNLIEFVLSENDTYTYVVGDTLPTITDDNGNTLIYTFTVDEINSEYATITFNKK